MSIGVHKDGGVVAGGDELNFIDGNGITVTVAASSDADSDVDVTIALSTAAFTITGALTLTGALTVNGATVTLADTTNIVLNATTGTKIGTATTQKLGFYNATPVAQGASVADASGGVTVDAEARTAINALISRIEATGLIATV